jgi:sulfatase maturation enzyme AslB (radical SAM superfamily)
MKQIQIIKKVLLKQLLWCYRMFRGLSKKLLYKCLPKKLHPKMYLFFLRRAAGKRLVVKKLLSFEVNVADHCNLNCRGCEHFSPLAKESYINIDSYTRDCARLSELTGGRIDTIHLMGGEPLLYPRLLEIFSITRQAFPSGGGGG